MKIRLLPMLFTACILTTVACSSKRKEVVANEGRGETPAPKNQNSVPGEGAAPALPPIDAVDAGTNKAPAQRDPEVGGVHQPSNGGGSSDAASSQPNVSSTADSQLPPTIKPARPAGELRDIVEVKRIDSDDLWRVLPSGDMLRNLVVSGSNMAGTIWQDNKPKSLVTSRDDGSSWTVIESINGDKIPMYQSLRLAGSAIDLVTRDHIFSSPDFGKTWRKASLRDIGLPIDAVLMAGARDGTEVVLISYSQRQLRLSIFDGASWDTAPVPNLDTASDVYVRGSLVVVSGGLTVGISDDLGVAWKYFQTENSSLIRSSGSEWFLASNQGTASVLSAAGTGIYEIGSRNAFSSIFLLPDVIVAGDVNAGLEFSFDSGNSWEVLSTKELLGHNLVIEEMTESQGVLYLNSTNGIYSLKIHKDEK